MGALRRRRESRSGRRPGEAHHGGRARTTRHRNDRDARRRSPRTDLQLGRERDAVGARTRGQRDAADAVDQHRSPLHLDGGRRVAHLLRRARSPARPASHRAHRRSRGHEVRRLAAAKRRVRPAIRSEIVKKAADLISQRIAELGDWRGETLARMRKLIKDADPDIVEEWKWANPVWSHDGIICTGESYKKAVKLTFP